MPRTAFRICVLLKTQVSPTPTRYTICEVLEASENPLWTNPTIIVPNSPDYITPKSDGMYVKYLGPPWDVDKLSLIKSFVQDRPHLLPPPNWLESKCVIKSMAYSYAEAQEFSIPIAKKIMASIKRKQANQSKGKRPSATQTAYNKKAKSLPNYPGNVVGINEFVQSSLSPGICSEVIVSSCDTASSTVPHTENHMAANATRSEQATTPLSEVAMNEQQLNKRNEDTRKTLFAVPSLMEPLRKLGNSGVSHSGDVDQNQENLNDDMDFDPDDLSWLNQSTNEHMQNNSEQGKDCSREGLPQTNGIIDAREDDISFTVYADPLNPGTSITDGITNNIQWPEDPLNNTDSLFPFQVKLLSLSEPANHDNSEIPLTEGSNHNISITSSASSLASPSGPPALVVHNDYDCIVTKKDLHEFGNQLMEKMKKGIKSAVSSCFERKCGKQLDIMGTDVKTIMNLSLNHFPKLDLSNVIPIEDLQREYLFTLPMRNAADFAHLESLLVNNVRDFNSKLKRYIMATTSNKVDALESMRLVFKKFFYKGVLALYITQKPINIKITKPLFTETEFFPAVRDAFLQVYNVGNVLKLNETSIKKLISSVFNLSRSWTTPAESSAEGAVPSTSSG
ncbi:hypothetical protein QAD02_014162 [Eretmocerus hayati]|uniref:Uncharacterized protein n=1 Tax=Eretmocerus hayati TaxID=131215 RepID=A0ACC2P9B7_9HYME|nr:hypothetical protein QAD02_014162 [Eretmocerus hayati]